MKKVFTVIILFSCLKLSAAIVRTGTLRLSDAKLQTDTPKINKTATHGDGLKLKTGSAQSDSVDVLALMNHHAAIQPEEADFKTDNSTGAPAFADNHDELRSITSLIQLDSLKSSLILDEEKQAEQRKLILRNEQIKLAEILKINSLDSLKQQLRLTASDTVKALIYTRMALKFLDYDTIAKPGKQLHYQNEAINYTLLAIREYSGYNDSTGLRDAYNNLSKVYYSQKKYTEAKWFILQSNTLARAERDTPNIISSLLTLAAIKRDIKDYSLATADLDDALQLSISSHLPKTQLEVLRNYALFYSILQNYPKEALMLKKRDSLLDSIRKTEEVQLAKAAAQKKRLDLLNKKKLLLASTRKSYKTNSPAKTASF